MKKILLIGIAIVSVLAFTSCKTSSESSYKKAYEKAKAQEMENSHSQQTTTPVAITPVVSPVTTTTTTQTTQTTQSYTPVVENKNNDKQERLNVMNGGTIKSFNVVCGSFSKIDNANNLRNTLVSKGYSAQVAQNPETGMYRVIAATFDDRAAAVSLRDQLKGTYPDAWLLYRTY